MKRYLDKLISALKSLLSKGFFHIVVGNTLVKCVSLCSAILLPRILVPESVYGMLGTVDNVNSYLILINGLGMANSVLRYSAMKDTLEEKTAVFRFCLKFGILADGLIILVFAPLLMFSTLFSGGNYGASKGYILVACLIPMLTYVQEVAMIYMRANLLNKAYAKISVVYTLLYAGFQVLLALFFSLTGVFVGRYIALSITAAICFWLLYRNKVLSKEPAKISKDEKKKIIWYAMGTMVTNAFSLIMPYNETLVVNLVLQNLDSTAYYKAASMIPSNLQFIATSVVVFIFPYFAKKTGQWGWIRKKSLLVILGMLGIMVPIMAVGYLLSPQLILWIYGENYSPAIEIMKPMWVAFGLNAIVRIPLGNILAALGELKFNIILSAVISLLHLALDYYFISNMGIGGAAYALMIAYGVSGLCSVIYIFTKRERV